jgi:Putative MetA-pathway of phenol degradation
MLRTLIRSLAVSLALLGSTAALLPARAGETEPSSATPAPDKSKYTLFNPTPIELRRAYNTDRPSKTDSPYTIDAGVFQIETDLANWTVDRNNVDDANIRVRTWLVAQTNFKIGLTNWMDFQIFPQGYVNRRTSGSDFGTPLNQSGFGDTTVRLKINFVGNDGGKLAVALVSSLKIPTNTDNLGNDAYEPGFGVPVNYALPGGFTFFGQARIDILDEPAGDRRLLWSSPVGVSRTIAGKLSGYVEFYNAVNLNYDRPWIGTLDVGLIYQVTPNFSVDINSFFGLTDSADDVNVFVGFARRF